MFGQPDRNTEEVTHIGLMEVAQQYALRLDSVAHLFHLHCFITYMNQNKVGLRGYRFQERLVGKHVKETLSLLYDTLNVIECVIQVFERLDSSNMSGDVDLEGALRPTHLGHNPLMK